MGKTTTFLIIILCASISFAGIYCKADSKKLGDESGQVLCPVMGGKIDKKVYVDHNGKRVYLCCTACVDKFKADPGKYMKKLEGVKLDGAPGAMKGHEGHNHN